MERHSYVKVAALCAAVVVNLGLAVGLHVLATAAQAPTGTVAAGSGGAPIRLAAAAPSR
jgi:hypothetical protein